MVQITNCHILKDLLTFFHSVPGSCQEQPRSGLCWRPSKKKDPVAVTQQLKTFTQLGPSNPEASLSYCKDLPQGCWRMSVGDGKGPGAPGEHRRFQEKVKDNNFKMKVILEFPITCTRRGDLLTFLTYNVPCFTLAGLVIKYSYSILLISNTAYFYIQMQISLSNRYKKKSHAFFSREQLFLNNQKS